MSEERSLGMPLEIARQNLRADPHVGAVAKELGVELDVYVERVLHYALHPDEDPQLDLLDAESVQSLGRQAPSVQDVTAWFEAAAQGGVLPPDRVEVAAHDGFTTESAPAERLRPQVGGHVPRWAPGVEELPNRRAVAPPADEAGSDAQPDPAAALRRQLLEQQQRGALGLDARRAGRGSKPR